MGYRQKVEDSDDLKELIQELDLEDLKRRRRNHIQIALKEISERNEKDYTELIEKFLARQ